MNKIINVVGTLTICMVIVFVTGVARAEEKPEIFVQMGHTQNVSSAAFTPDGNFLLSGSDDKTMKLWDVATGRELRTFSGPDYPITSIAISPDGKYAISGDEDYFNNLTLWDVTTGKKIRTFRGHGDVGTRCVAFTPDGKYVLSGGDTTVKLWDITSGKEVRTFLGNSAPVSAIVISADGKYVVSGCRENSETDVKSTGNTITVWDFASGTLVRRFNNALGWVKSLAISPDGKYVISGDFKDSIRVWEVTSGRQIKSFDANGVSSIAISPDGKYALLGGVMGITLWNISAGVAIERIGGLRGWVHSVAFSPDGSYSRALSADESKTPKLWDIASGKQIMAFGGSAQKVASVLISPDGKKLVVGQDYGFVHIWDIASGRQIETIKNNLGIASMAIDGGGTLIGAGGWDFSADSITARFWNVATGKEISTIRNDGGRWPKSLTIDPDQIHALWTIGPTLLLSDLKTGKQIRTYSGHKANLEYAAMSSDGRFAVSSDPEQAIIWEIETGKVLKTYSRENAILTACSNGKSVLVIISQLSHRPTMALWDFQSNKETMSRVVNPRRGFGRMAMSPDGRYAIAEDNWILSLWDIAKGKELSSFSGHTNSITSLGISPDQKYLYSGSDDGTTRFWDISTGKEIARFVSFTNGEWIVITPEGYFNASPNGAQYLNVRVGNNVYSIDNFCEKFYNPSYVASVLQGKKEETIADIRKGFALPPQVKITSPAPGAESKSDVLTVTISAKDMGGGIDEIRLYQNGKMISDDQRGMKNIGTIGENVTKSYQVTLLSGLNTFRAVAFNRERTESNPDEIKLELKAAQAASDLYLFAIGINEYKNSKYNLNYGKSDAMAFLNTVVKRSRTIFKEALKYQLYDGEATRPSIEAIFKTIAAAAKPQDTFVFYYAGHGVMSEGTVAMPSDFYLIPTDVTNLYGDDAMLAAKAVSAAQLRTFCTTIKAQKQLVVLDACQSGGAVKSFATRGLSEERAIIQLARSAGTFLIASTGTEQFATEFATLAHGVFTYALLQGLNGNAGNPKDGKITVIELEAYLNDEVPELTKKYHGTAQYPNSCARGQDFPLGVK